MIFVLQCKKNENRTTTWSWHICQYVDELDTLSLKIHDMIAIIIDHILEFEIHKQTRGVLYHYTRHDGDKTKQYTCLGKVLYGQSWN